MARTTRSAIKQEPVADASHTPDTSCQLPNRAHTVSSAATPTPSQTPTSETINISSGSTTIPDPDVEMAGTPAVPHDSTSTQDAHDVLAKMSSSSKDLIQAIQNIAGLDLKATLPPLPTFIVLGDQSAGKSSIIQSISNITLPRSEGTTTRCPFRITTTATEPDAPHAWTCTISLEHEYTFDPSASGPRMTFQQWRLRDKADIDELVVLHDKAQLEHWLKIAQAAILNPGKNSAHFAAVSGTLPQKSQVAFSPNVVRLHIESPELLDLDFYDLPGLISFHDSKEHANQAVVKFIEELADHYIKNPNALILFACYAFQDCNTTLTLPLIMRAQATDRCIGVLTKPDQVASSELNSSQIPAILRGDKFSLNGGWFVTRQPSLTEIERGITYEEARQQEREFFAQQPWSTSPFVERLGTPALQVYIAGRLRDHIISQLPKIQVSVQTEIGSVIQSLANFPEQDGHPIAAVSVEIQQVVALVEHELGDRSRPAFREDYNNALSKFETALEQARPQVSLVTPKPLSISLDSDDEAEPSPAPTPTPSRFATPSKKRPLPMGSQPPSTGKRAKQEPGVKPTLPRPRFTLQYIRDEYRRGCASGIAGERQPEVTDRLSLAAVQTWDPIVDILLNEVENGVKKFVGLCIDHKLSARMETKLRRSALAISHRLVSEMLAEQGKRIAAILASEQHATWTSDTMEHQRAEWFKKITETRLKFRIDDFFDSKQQKKTGKVIIPEDREAKRADVKWQDANLPRDTWQEEAEALVKPLAYYHLASRRFQETVKSGLEWGFVHQICERLGDRLKRDLGADDIDKCRELLLEQPEREREKKALQAKLGKLEAAMAELAGLSGEKEE